MAFFTLNSNITIGKLGVNALNFSGVNEVRIKRSLHTYLDTATITLPSIAYVKYKNSATPVKVITGNLWNDGDPVTINLGYNGGLQEEFRGFVKRRNLNMPLTIECEGYSYQLKRNRITNSWKSVSVKELLQVATANTDIKVICTVDVDLINIQAVSSTGAEILDYIHKATDGTLSCFFIQPDTLWCGLIYTPYSNNGVDPLQLSTVKYRLGYNVIKDNNLKQRSEEDYPQVRIYVKKTAKGQRLYGSSEPSNEVTRFKKALNHVPSNSQLAMLAQEKRYRENYTGYEGHITGFLQPFALPGYKAFISDSRYPDLQGTYIIESTDVTYGHLGARRILEIGPKIGFAA